MKNLKLHDINGLLIEVGDTVETKQPGGGILPPGPPQIGIAEHCVDAFQRPNMCIRFRKEGQNFDRYILLDGKINTVIK